MHASLLSCVRHFRFVYISLSDELRVGARAALARATHILTRQIPSHLFASPLQCTHLPTPASTNTAAAEASDRAPATKQASSEARRFGTSLYCTNNRTALYVLQLRLTFSDKDLFPIPDRLFSILSETNMLLTHMYTYLIVFGTVTTYTLILAKKIRTHLNLVYT